MQEEVENRTVNFAVTTSKLTTEALMRGIRLFLQRSKGINVAKGGNAKGRQSVKQLIGQGQGIMSVDAAGTEIRKLMRFARKYGLDYAITKDREAEPSKYTVFFKAKDTNVVEELYKNYGRKAMGIEEERPSVMALLEKMKEKAIVLFPKKIRNRTKERFR